MLRTSPLPRHAILGVAVALASTRGPRAQEPERSSPPEVATAQASDEDFSRVSEDQDRPAFQVAAVEMVGPDGVKLTLYSAVHIADAAHYQDLQRRFAKHDALLYELIGPPTSRPYPGQKRRSRGGVSLIQGMLKNALGLSFQLEQVDYRPENFVHADLTPGEFQRIAKERGESMAQLMFRAMQNQMREMRERSWNEDDETDGKPAEHFDLVSAFRRREGRHYLRLAMSKMLTDIERTSAGFAGQDGESIIVEIRNKKALQVLEDQITEGKRNLGLYYGAAHMPDFVERLEARGFKTRKSEWMTAWDLRLRKDPERKRRPSTRKAGAKRGGATPQESGWR